MAAKVYNAAYLKTQCSVSEIIFPKALGFALVDRSTRWGNPFVIGRDGDRAEVIAKYTQWLFENPLPQREVDWLHGRHLVCHCAPEPCHADVLLRYVNFHFQRAA